MLIKRYTVSAKTKPKKIGFNKQGINTPIIKKFKTVGSVRYKIHNRRVVF